MNPDVIVIGAGIAGLAAAGELARHGWSVRLLEARDRTGGRLLSATGRGWPHPVELGAEFIHGGNRPLRALLRQAGLGARPVNSNMWWHHEGGLSLIPDFWSRIRRVTARIPARNRGRSFRQFLREDGRSLSAEDRHLAETYVASFNAAPPGRLSAHAMRVAHAGADTPDLKMEGPYDALAVMLQRSWPRGRVDLRLRSEVTAIRWHAGAVTVVTRTPGRHGEKHHATAVVITLPLGVLQAHTVDFDPPLREKQRIIARMGWGQVTRVVLRFRPGFWSAPFLPPALAAGSGRGFGFVNAPEEQIPVWWALAPPAPVLTGWAGGPAAAPLGQLRPAAIRDAALRSLAAIFKTPATTLRRALADWRMHDWTRDPFARGAYSFVAAGAEDAAPQLAEPVEDTLFFAGEATSVDTGTVHGALASGLRAAHEVTARLNRRRRTAVANTLLALY